MKNASYYKAMFIKAGLLVLLIFLGIRFIGWRAKEPKRPSVKQQMVLSGQSLAPLSLCEALRQATLATNSPYDAYTVTNQEQRQFTANDYSYYIQNKLYETFSAQELTAFASNSVASLNDVLAKEGYSVRFAPFKSPQSIGIISLQNITVSWMSSGQVTSITKNEKQYDAFTLREEVRFFESPEGSLVIVQIKTQNKDLVYMAVGITNELFDSQPTDRMIIQKVQEYKHQVAYGSFKESEKFDGVTVPMIDYRKKIDVNWLRHMGIGASHVVEQAIQEVQLTMDEKGAQVKAAAAAEIGEIASLDSLQHKITLVIDKPFIVWIERPEVEIPVFMDLMSEQYWKRPMR